MNINNEEKEDILYILKNKNKIKKYFFLVIGCFFVAFAFNVFFSPNSLVTGGVSGISIVIEKLFGIPTELFIFISYILLILLSFIFLGFESTKNSIIGSILYPIFVYLTKDMASMINFNVDNMLLICVFGALISGLGSGLTFKYGFSTGGSDIILQILAKYLKISIGDAMKIFNMVIIIGSGFFLGENYVYAWENVLYAIITVYLITILTDKILLGISSSKSFYVITEHETDMKKFLMNQLGRGVTVLEGCGGYTGDRKKVIMCAIPTRQYFLAKEGISRIDKDAIILINDVYESKGIDR